VSAPDFPAVLFVCTYNRVRSPMAAGLMRYLYGPAAQVDSCGLEPGEEVDPLAAAVMAEVGVDLSDHLPQKLGDLLAAKRYRHVVALSDEAWDQVKDKVGTDVAIHWLTFDPTHEEGSRDSRLEAYRLIRGDLQARIIGRFGSTAA
jgi:protein-tyrosine-phosphatase